MEPRKRKRLLLAFAGLVAFVAGLLAVFYRNEEPTYNGRPLSEWVVIYHGPFGHVPLSSERVAAAEAIRVIGADGLPFLLAWLDHQTPRWQMQVANVLDRVSASRPNRLRDALARLDREREARAHASVAAFRALGPLAAPAIPELERRLYLKKQIMVVDRAFYALAHIGTLGAPALTNAFSSQLDRVQQNCLHYIRQMETNAILVVPLLLANTTHTNTVRAVNSAQMLGELQLDPAHVVPALTNCLADPRREVRQVVPLALVRFGAAAQPALPALTNALNDPDATIREAANWAIGAIHKYVRE